ncbi:hypothetical protein GCM10022414_07940 [Zhongshania borealis]|uniref:Uncharacterized protein n=1 Tax=Zhongshania borealis TaxID=889488 RepID=A0ABP7WFK2_9GAMM
MNKRQLEMFADTVELVEKRGGTLISSSYISSKSPLTVECSEKHQWLVNRDALKGGDWCQGIKQKWGFIR